MRHARRLSLFLRGSWLGWVLVSSSAAALVWPDVVVRVEHGLSSENAEQRRVAVRRLSDLPRRAAQPLLERALLDPDPRVRLHAADAAVHLGHAAAAPVVVAWLGDQEPAVRRAAAEVLRAFPHQPALARLARALTDPDAEVRQAVAQALGASGSSEATSALLAHLDDAQPGVVLAVVDALERLGDPRAAVPLVGRVQDPRASVRRAVARALGSLGGESAVRALILASRDSDANVRVAVVAALGQTRHPLAVEALRHQLQQDTDLDVRVATLNALVQTGEASAVRAVIGALDDPRIELVDAAREALRQLGPDTPSDTTPDPTANTTPTAELEACLDSGQANRSRAEGCASALAALRSAGAYDRITRAWAERSLGAEAALSAMGELGDPRALPLVLEQLSSDDPAVRLAAVRTAGQLLEIAEGDGRAVEPIARAWSQRRGSSEESLALVLLLGQTRAERAAPLLRSALNSEAPRLRVAALRALGQVGGWSPELETQVLAGLDAAHGAIRFEAALALRRSGSKAVLPALLERLTQPQGRDRRVAALALAGPLSRLAAGSDEREQWVARLIALLPRLEPSSSDALLEALAQAPGPARERAFAELGSDARLRPKIAEVWAYGVSAPRALASEPRVTWLRRWLRDASADVRANAVYALGLLEVNEAREEITALLTDPHVAVAANAAVALSKVTSPEQARAPLCAALEQARAPVRVNALAGLARLGVRCAPGIERRLLERDSAELVRERAAWLLQATAGAEPDAEREALERCRRDDPSSRVAAACAARRSHPFARSAERSPTQAFTIFVVPSGAREPAPGAAFAANTGDGTLRFGSADRGGAVLLLAEPGVELTLEVAH